MSSLPPVRRFASLAATLAFGAVAGPAAAQTYLQPENAARREMAVDNPYCGGQPSDLEFELVEPVTYESTPCSTGQKEILKSATFKVKVRWKTSTSWYGLPAVQAEGSDSTNGDD
jgi:hypothetical protein